LRILVCGGRDWRDAEVVERALSSLHAARGPFNCLIHGGARGVDRIAGKWARKNGILEWNLLPEWHRAGTPDGPARNQRMIAAGVPDLVVAFPGGRGTADMVERAKAAGVEVIETLGRSSQDRTPDGVRPSTRVRRTRVDGSEKAGRWRGRRRFSGALRVFTGF
jgi:hypothetical protein